MSAKIEIRQLGKQFKNFEALRDISLRVETGAFVALVGASGCGKSTLLRIIAGLETRSTGQILVDNVPVSKPGRDRAMVFQDYSLYPWLTVTQNIRFCRNLSAHRRKHAPGDVAEALRRRAD
jgi:NitT/TauT family transport system ATP-binding protein